MEYVVCVTLQFLVCNTGETPVQNGVHTLTQKFEVFVQKDKSINIAWFKTGAELAHSQTCLWEYPLGWFWCSWNTEQTLSNYCQSGKRLALSFHHWSGLVWRETALSAKYCSSSSPAVRSLGRHLVQVECQRQWFDLICFVRRFLSTIRAGPK